MRAEQKAYPGGEPTGSLEIRAAWMQWNFVVAALPPAVSAALGLISARGFYRWLDLILVASLGMLTGATFVRQCLWRMKGTLLEIDEDGLHFLGGHHVPWAGIAAVRRTRKGTWDGLVFIGWPGVVPPLFSIRLFTLRSPERRAEVTVKRWGSPLVLFPVLLDTSAERLLEAVRRFGGGIPVHGGRYRDLPGGPDIAA